MRPQLTFLSSNMVKSYYPHHLSQDRLQQPHQAVPRGMHHGFIPDHNRLDQWRTPT